MKRNLQLCFFLFIFSVKLSVAQIPNWQWAKSAGAVNDESSNSVIADVSGNVYVTGYFSSPTITFGSYTLTNAGNFDVFIVKYDAAGNIIWAKSAGGIYDDIGFGVAADGNGNVFITGYYYSPTISFGTYTLTNVGGGDIFIVKYDAGGNEIWAKSEGGTFDDNGYGITVDPAGNPVITGFFQSSTLISGTYTLTNTGNNDVFIIKYDGSGNTQWAKSGKGASNDQGTAVTTDAAGNIIVTGFFYSASVIFETYTLTTSGSSDLFVVKYNPSGNAMWAKSGGGIYNDFGYAIATDLSGNIFITGSFLSPTLTIGTFTCSNAGNFDILTAKYDGSGNEHWAKSEGGIFDDAGFGIATDAIGNPYITGHFHSPSIAIGTYTLNNNGVGDIFVAQYDGSGNINWAKGEGGTSDEQGTCISIDTGGNIYIAGYFYSSSISFNNNTVTSGGMSDMYVAKLGSIIILGSEKLLVNNNDMQIYPNPSAGEFKINNNGLKIIRVEIYNEFGGKIFESDIIQDDPRSFNISNQAKGIYFVSIKTDRQTLSRKLIIE
jgi:hypothetical protein